eukprot:9488234-Pyramimonas_sp.AAC.2
MGRTTSIEFYAIEFPVSSIAQSPIPPCSSCVLHPPSHLEVRARSNANVGRFSSRALVFTRVRSLRGRSQEGGETLQGPPEKLPRVAQYGPRGPQCSQTGQDAPKTLQEGPQTASRGVQEGRNANLKSKYPDQRGSWARLGAPKRRLRPEEAFKQSLEVLKMSHENPKRPPRGLM